jgi:hypothetical protein
VGEAPDEGRGVEVLDDGDAEFRQGRSSSLDGSALLRMLVRACA